MQLFLFLNDLAGRNSVFDGVARFFYVGAVPLLAALFFGHLLLLGRQDNTRRGRLALAVGLSLLFLALIGVGIEALAQSWHLGTLSPRPFMTRRVQLLVVEPQDNSFPCYEVAVAAIFATALWFLSRKWGAAGAILTLLLGLTRLFCGTNFGADVAVGALLGSGLCAAFSALCTSQHPFERAALQQWGLASTLVALSLGGSYFAFAQTPRYAAKMPLFWSSTATAAAQNAPEARKATRAARAAIGEGEGLSETDAPHDAARDLSPVMASNAGQPSGGQPSVGQPSVSEPSAEELALSKRSHLFLPVVEKFLRGKMAPGARPFTLLDVEVAPVKAGNTTFRCAAIRFEINQKTPDLRRQTAEIAARLVKLAFQSDSNLQNVDVTAILRGDGAQIDGSALRFAGEEVPVFTASVARQNLRVAAPRWANAPRLDGGSWLRTRSRLYINGKILPATRKPRAPTPRPAILKTSPKPTLKPTAIPAKPSANTKPGAKSHPS